jgi:hypothetical protein
MHNNPSHQDVTVEVPRPLIMLGSALIISGLMITCYIAAQVLQIYHSTNLNPFVLHIQQLLSNKELITVDGQAIIIGEASAITSAIALFAVLAWVGISIGIGLIRAGANIVSPVFRTELATLKLRLTELTKRINKNE